MGCFPRICCFSKRKTKPTFRSSTSMDIIPETGASMQRCSAGAKSMKGNNTLKNLENNSNSTCGFGWYGLLNADDEGDVCRICSDPGDPGNPLRRACACNGSIKFVHKDCLLQWIKHSKSRICQVCKQKYSFTRCFDKNAPAARLDAQDVPAATRLSFQEIFIRLAIEAGSLLWGFLRAFGSSPVSSATILAFSYFFVFSLAIFYPGMVITFNIRYPRGRFHCTIASIAETIPSLFEQLIIAAKRRLSASIMVLFLLVVGLGIFPMMCMRCLDVCSINIYGMSISHRGDCFLVWPLAAFLVHWIEGILFMRLISIILINLPQLVLPYGALQFLLDPNYNMFRQKIDEPLHKDALRVLFSIALCGCLFLFWC